MKLRNEVWSILLLAAFATVTAESEDKNDQTNARTKDRETRSFSSIPRDGNDAFRPEHRLLDEPKHRSLEEVKQLEYYGGAKGQFLIIHPSGQMFISRGETREKEESSESEEEDVGMEEGGTTGNEGGGSDSVAIKPPPENASIAEAKPVGLAVAGPGGVASSRPSATAVVGPGGLALARPIATAIAGVDGGGPPIVISPAVHTPAGPIPPPAPAPQNAIPHSAYIPQFYYPRPPFHQSQPVFLYPLGYFHGRGFHQQI